MKLRGKLRENHPLAEYTSWRIGGAARIFYQPADLEDLAQFLRNLSTDEKYIFFLGAGSNVLISDAGIDGVVICTKDMLTKLEEINDNVIRAEAGVSCVNFAKFCAEHSLTGAEFLTGIPGTIGGALAMNAGAFGNETWDHIISVETIDHDGNLHTRTPVDFKIEYRHVTVAHNEWFVAAQFSFTKGKEDTINKQIKEIMAERAQKQPIAEQTCGSVFRNPENDYAARLIEDCGLKGKQIGGAKVSEKHANFIVNIGGATAEDIKQLIKYIKKTVKKRHDVDLELEVLTL